MGTRQARRFHCARSRRARRRRLLGARRRQRGGRHSPEDPRQVHHALGPPVAAGPSSEEFTSRRKFAEPWAVEPLLMGDVVTAGLGEFIWLPPVLYREARRVLAGRSIQVTYDPAGRVTGIRIDGDPVPWVSPPGPDGPPPEPAANQ